MRKSLTLALLLICVFTFASCGMKSAKDYDLYCYEINKVIKNLDFDKGNIVDFEYL